jgi:hypothetical protein
MHYAEWQRNRWDLTKDPLPGDHRPPHVARGEALESERKNARGAVQSEKREVPSQNRRSLAPPRRLGVFNLTRAPDRGEAYVGPPVFPAQSAAVQGPVSDFFTTGAGSMVGASCTACRLPGSLSSFSSLVAR